MNSVGVWPVLKGVDGVSYIMPQFMDGIIGLVKFMEEVIYGEKWFHALYVRRDGVEGRVVSSLGSHVGLLHSYSLIYSSEYTFSPLLAFFFEEYRHDPIFKHARFLDKADVDGLTSLYFNQFVARMRRRAIDVNLKKKMSDWDGKSKKNLHRLERVEQALFERYSRLMVVRLDFNYHKARFTREDVERAFADAQVRNERDLSRYFDNGDISMPKAVEGRIALEEVQKDREHFFANRKGKPSLFEHLVGYAWCIEYGREAGYHLHVMLFFNGSEVEKHEYIADQIGCYWRDVITNGRGYFENCNRKRSAYGGDWALGQVDHSDTQKREKLRKAMSYFCKTNQLVQVVPYPKCRLFGCSGPIRRKRPAGGRPRSMRAGQGAANQRAER
ncbi:inovirus-type Gp2 protein [Burkholderia sp. 22PA0106]|uniref:YagK/YfjJ domain-containing protein n=1 Tax=Burkholderia sp. 22PA0106 TaxID=3237371 RepID=UPI0039C4112A